MNDPCPDGWKVPSMPEWENLLVANDSDRVWTGNGFKIGGNFYMPAVGYRNGGSGGAITGVGTDGYYWSSSVYSGSNNYAAALSLKNSGFTSNNGIYATNGYSVRCIAE